MKKTLFERVGFLVSVVLLAVLYGYGAKAFGWFPGKYLDMAVRQANRVMSEPLYLSPRVYNRAGVRIVDAAAVQQGLTLIATRWKDIDWDPGLKLISTDGHTLHEWHVDPAWFLDEDASPRAGLIGGAVKESSLNGVYLFPNGEVLVNLSYVGTAKLDACSRVQWVLPAGSHHSIARTDDGSFWIPASSPGVQGSTPANPDGLPGIKDPVYLDQILRVSAEGQRLESLNVLDLLYANRLQRHIFKSNLTDTTDVTHLNDVEPLSSSLAGDFPIFEPGDLLVSLRNLDLVLVFDPDTRKVKWHASHPFVEQHDPDFLEGGWIGVFDNNRDGTFRGTVLGGSRLVAIHPRMDSVRVLFPTPRSDPFHSEFMGNWQQLQNGNRLLTESLAGRVIEVTPNGRTVWEWVNEPYEESMVPEVTEATRYDLTPKEVADWPCSRPGREAGSADSG